MIDIIGMYTGDDETIKCALHLFLKAMAHIKECDINLYDCMEEELYVAKNGYHFDEETLEHAFSKMENDNGTKAPYWSLEQTNSYARSSGISFDNFNEYDWCYVMNMLYSDYCSIYSDNSAYYIKMAHKFLVDKDGGEGKALKYYLAISK